MAFFSIYDYINTFGFSSRYGLAPFRPYSYATLGTYIPSPRIDFNFGFGRSYRSSYRSSSIDYLGPSKNYGCEKTSRRFDSSGSTGSKIKPKVSKSNLGKGFVSEELVSGYSINKCKHTDLVNLKPEMKEILVQLDKKAQELGYTMVVSDGFRSHVTQAAAKKRKPKLCATPGKSAHEYGAAIDLAMYKDGKAVSIDKIPEFARYAQSLGLEWGATWKSKYEPWHFNFVRWQARADIRDEYNAYNGRRNYA